MSPALLVKDPRSLYQAKNTTLVGLARVTAMATDASCGLHFHVSLHGHQWSLDNVKRVARAVLWFEPGAEVLVPQERRTSTWCKSHSANSAKLVGADAIAAQALVTACETLETVVDVMTGVGWDGKFYSVNFRNLIDVNRPSTIEFRRAPSSANPWHVCVWAEFVMSFVQSALEADESELREYTRDVLGLRRFLNLGISISSSVSELMYVDSIFDGLEGSLEPQEAISDDEEDD